MRRRALLASLHQLPNGYVRKQYIESSGTQYIDTGITAKAGLSSAIEMSFTKVSSDVAILGARKNYYRFYLAHYYGSFAMGYGEYFTSGITATADTKYTIETVLKVNEQRMSIDGSETIVKSVGSNIDLGLNLYLFGMNYDGTINYCASARCYSCKIYDNGVLVRDFVPCTDPSGVYGMYDLVGKEFYASKRDSFTGA